MMLIAVVLLSATGAFALDCAVDVPIAGSLQASGKGRYTDYPTDIPLFTGTAGTVSGAVRVVLPAVAGSCDFSKASATALATAIAAAKLQTATPLAVTQMAGAYPFANMPDPTNGAYKLAWTVGGLQLTLASDAVGGRINQVKRVASLRATVPAGVTNVKFNVGAAFCPPNGWAADFTAPLAGANASVFSPVTAGCALQIAKSNKAITLDCSKLKVDLGTVDVFFAPQAGAAAADGEAAAGARRRLLGCSGVAAPAPSAAAAAGGARRRLLGDHLQMWLRFEVAKGAKLGGGANLADAHPLAA